MKLIDSNGKKKGRVIIQVIQLPPKDTLNLVAIPKT